MAVPTAPPVVCQCPIPTSTSTCLPIIHLLFIEITTCLYGYLICQVSELCNDRGSVARIDWKGQAQHSVLTVTQHHLPWAWTATLGAAFSPRLERPWWYHIWSEEMDRFLVTWGPLREFLQRTFVRGKSSVGKKLLPHQKPVGRLECEAIRGSSARN